jgi:hypothetical protein
MNHNLLEKIMAKRLSKEAYTVIVCLLSHDAGEIPSDALKNVKNV